MKQECLNNLGILGDQETSEASGDEGEMPNTFSAQTVNLDAGRFQSGQARGVFSCRARAQAIDHRRKPAAINAERQLG